ncbi:uncharacterized protein LOC141527874 [Cotesia typhae]|uniref:uncharacterized protein LOC141527874 n=1 Tax=Cotesia typhae TaxID=2053667 RepID=UPI003D69A1F4
MQTEKFYVPIEKITKPFVLNLESNGLLTNLNANFKMAYGSLTSPTLLEIAIWNWDEELFDYLVYRKVSLEGTANGTVLHLAVHRCGTNLSIAKKLISLGVPINRRECMLHWTPLHLACYQGKLEMAELLIDSGADINISDIYNVSNPESNLGRRPLHIAVEANQEALVKLLCRKRANLNAQALEQGTPLVYAVALGREEIAHELIQRGADVNALVRQCYVKTDLLNYIPVEEFHLTALHVAIMKSQERMLRILLMMPATNLNSVINNFTPLHLAIRLNSKLLKTLLAAGADINVRTANDRNIIEFCCDVWAGDPKTRDRISALLVEHATKLQAAGLYVAPEITTLCSSQFLDLCKRELELMKRTKICAWSSITVDKILGCCHTLATNLHLKDLQDLIEYRFNNYFAIYGDILKWRLNKIYQRRRLLTTDNSNVIFGYLFEIVFQKLIPKKFVERIMIFLSYGDLVEILRTWKIIK